MEASSAPNIKIAQVRKVIPNRAVARYGQGRGEDTHHVPETMEASRRVVACPEEIDVVIDVVLTRNVKQAK